MTTPTRPLPFDADTALPVIGFGTYPLRGRDGVAAIRSAISASAGAAAVDGPAVTMQSASSRVTTALTASSGATTAEGLRDIRQP